MGVLETCKARARNAKMRVVFPEMEDPLVAEAARQLEAEGLANIVPLAPISDRLIAAIRGLRPMKANLAKRMLTRPLIRAAAMVGARQADVMVAGISCPSKKVIEAASLAIGLADDCATPSSFFLMRFPNGREIILADCALNVAPNADELSDIARASSKSAKAILGKSRLALLSYSTGQSGTGSSVDKVRAVAKTTGFAGPIQADAALNAVIAQKKGISSDVANTLIFPSLDAGNIAYKLLQELAGAQAIGPILQGFRHPVCDLSRGASVEDIVATTVLTIALGAKN